MTTPVSNNLQKNVTLEKYFELDLASDEKLEYWKGNVWSMSGASLAHNLIVRNAGTEFDIQLRQHDCHVLPSDMRVKVPAYPPYRYPDLTALCGTLQIEKIGGLDVLVNPSLIVEVLSPSSEALDRGDKFNYYQSIPTFQEYLLIAQHRPYVSHYWKLITSLILVESFNSHNPPSVVSPCRASCLSRPSTAPLTSSAMLKSRSSGPNHFSWVQLKVRVQGQVFRVQPSGCRLRKRKLKLEL